MEAKARIPLDILRQFDIPGELHSVEELKRGHINFTYVGVWRHNGKETRYVHQLVNHSVFKNIPGLMNNVRLITTRVNERIAQGEAKPGDTTLTVVPTRDGHTYITDAHGEHWRTFEFVENTVSYDVCSTPDVAREAGAILGRFQRYIHDVPVASLCEPIPHFIDGERRYDALDEALAKDPLNRVAKAKPEIEFALEYRAMGGSLVRALKNGEIPYRPTHNDVKLNNVLFSATTGQAVCLVDLDTCMPGTPLYDYGDLVRNTVIPCAEDELDLSKVRVDQDLLNAIDAGYMEEIGFLLTPREKALLPSAPRILALVLGVRFLTDHLLGDTYFRVHRTDHNLHRARTQFQVARVLS